MTIMIMRMPKPELNKARIYERLHMADYGLIDLPQSYWNLSPKQKQFIDTIIEKCEDEFILGVNEYNNKLTERDEYR